MTDEEYTDSEIAISPYCERINSIVIIFLLSYLTLVTMDNGAVPVPPGKGKLGDERDEEDDGFARRLNNLAMSSESSTTITTPSSTNLDNWVSSLGKSNFPIVISAEKQSVSPIVNCSIVNNV